MATPRPSKKSSEPVFWSTERILPPGFLPMLASTASQPPATGEFAYEVRWEGLRTLVGFEAEQLFARTGTGQEVAEWFPELGAVRKVAAPLWLLLDGEIVGLEEGQPSRGALQSRLRKGVPGAADEPLSPVAYVIYDILRIGDSWLLDVSWEERRDILRRAVEPGPDVVISATSPTVERAQARAAERGLEGVVAKRIRGRYFPGERTREWLSLRPTEVSEVVIAGWIEGQGAREGQVGGLLLGLYEEGLLIPVGHTAPVEEGFAETLQGSEQASCPFDSLPALPTGSLPARWVRPELVARVRHQGWTGNGKLRSPVFLELVSGADPARCRMPR
jgi:bifunctional non-homologous end joining protein LigD